MGCTVAKHRAVNYCSNSFQSVTPCIRDLAEVPVAESTAISDKAIKFPIPSIFAAENKSVFNNVMGLYYEEEYWLLATRFEGFVGSKERAGLLENTSERIQMACVVREDF